MTKSDKGDAIRIINRHKAMAITNLKECDCPQGYINLVVSELTKLRDIVTDEWQSLTWNDISETAADFARFVVEALDEINCERGYIIMIESELNYMRMDIEKKGEE